MTKTRDLADLGGGFIQAGTGAQQRTVESKLQDVVSVKDFGAVGDGVTDDTVAIQAAIDSLDPFPIRPGNGTIFFPSGTYFVSNEIDVRGENVCLKGESVESTIILRSDAGAAGAIIRLSANGTEPVSTTCYRNSIIDLTLKHSTPATANEGIRADAQYDLRIQNVEIINPYIGIQAKSCIYTFDNIFVNYEDDAYLTSTIGYASFLWARNGSGATDFTPTAGSGIVNNCRALKRAAGQPQPTQYNFLINSADGIWMTNCYARGASKDNFSLFPGDEFSRVSGVLATALWSDWANEAGLRVSNDFGGNCRNNSFSMMRVYGGNSGTLNTDYGIVIGDNAGLGDVYSTSIVACKINNTLFEGIRVEANTKETHITQPEVFNASFGSINTYNSVLIRPNASYWSIIGGAVDSDGAGGTSRAIRGIQVGAGCSDYVIQGVQTLRCQTTQGILDPNLIQNKLVSIPGRPTRGVRPSAYTSTQLTDGTYPATAAWLGESVYVSDSLKLAYSDGTNWRYFDTSLSV